MIGRPAAEPVGKRRTNASTRLEIAAWDLLDDDDEDAETEIFDESRLSGLRIEVRRGGPYEVFFRRDEASRKLAPSAQSFSPGPTNESARPPSGAAPVAAPASPSQPPGSTSMVDFDPAEIYSQIIKKLLTRARSDARAAAGSGTARLRGNDEALVTRRLRRGVGGRRASAAARAGRRCRLRQPRTTP